MRWIKKWPLSTLVSLCVLTLAVGLKTTHITLLDEMQLVVFDTFQRAQPREYTQQPVRIIDIDDESLAKLGQWPWPRTLMSDVIKRLNELGAAAIALDIVFAEPDRTSPKEIIKSWQAPQLRKHIMSLPDHDMVMAQTISQANVVAGFVFTNQDNGEVPERKASYAVRGENAEAFAMQFDGAVLSLPELTRTAAGNGALNSSPDIDGILRRVPLLYNQKGTLYPSLSAESLRIAQGARTYVVRTSEAGTGITDIRIGDFEIPTTANGQYWIHYTEYVPARYVPIWELLSEDMDPSLIEGHIVLIGTSAAGLKDIRATPLNPAASGVEVHAQAIEQILAGETLQRPDWMHGAEIMIMFAVGLILIVLMAFTNAILGGLFALSAQLIAFGISWYAFTEKGLLIDPVYASLALFFVYMTESLARYIGSEKEKRQVRGAFSQYLSPDLVKRLADNPDQLKLGGEIRTMTILFCDIRGFTTISEQYDAQGLTQFINQFLTPMTDIIMANRGTIDKYMGDCIMAFWNAPLDDEAHANNACYSAMRMFEALKVLNITREKEAKAENKPFIPVNIGIGLNTGECCVGNMGSDQRFDYSVLGDDVNLASRLEGQSKTYGVDIVIGHNTFQQVPDLATIEIDLIQVKGKTEPVHIYALLGDEMLAQEPDFKALKDGINAMIKAYRAQKWSDATRIAKQTRIAAEVYTDRFSLVTLFDLYEERIQTYQTSSPNADWDGVFIATSK